MNRRVKVCRSGAINGSKKRTKLEKYKVGLWTEMNIRILNGGIPVEKSITMGRCRTVNGGRTMKKSVIMYKR